MSGTSPWAETLKVPAKGAAVIEPEAPSNRVKSEASSAPEERVARALSSEIFPIAANPPSTAFPSLSTTEFVAMGPSVFVTVRLAP
ncbi:MAG: hypothetical protein CMP30_08115 [Roseibacillus sp.]|nr:hypothetical protein [Roseibacillus sp.]